MENGIKIDQADDVKVKVEELSKLISNINDTKFGDEVAIQALKLLGKSFSNPINITGCNVNHDASTQKYYKGSIGGKTND